MIKCPVVGIDISRQSLAVARQRRGEDCFPWFVEGDALALPFRDASFDVVVCGGTTAWINDRNKAISEFRRVMRLWGRLVAFPFFYQEEPPEELIADLNHLLGIRIEKWNLAYWEGLFTDMGFEQYFVEQFRAHEVNSQQLEQYITYLADRTFPQGAKSTLYEAALLRLRELFTCFNLNNRYLSYAVLIFRKRQDPEEKVLFD